MYRPSDPAGSGVAVQNCAESSSRMKIASPGGSLTGSLAHGVRRLSWLFRDHVYPAPLSVATKPNVGCATTFAQGCGGRAPADLSTTTTYSRPSSANPPVPLNDSRSADASAGVASADAAPAGDALFRIPPGS